VTLRHENFATRLSGGSEVQIDRSGPKVGSRQVVLMLLWPNEPGELSQWQFTATMTAP